MGKAEVEFVAISASIEIFFPEKKWVGLPQGAAFGRSFLAHCALGAVVVWLAMHAITPTVRESEATYIDVVLGNGNMSPIENESKHQITQAPRVRPHLQLAPAHKLSAPVHSTIVKVAKPRVIPQTTTPAPHQSSIAGVNTSMGPVSATPTLQETFSELDGRACSLFYGADPIRSSQSEQANKQYEQARILMERAVPLLKAELNGEVNNVLADAVRNTGRCYERLGKYERAIELYRESQSMFVQLEGKGSLNEAISLVYLGDALFASGKAADAETCFVQSLPVYAQRYGERSKEVAWTHQRLANVYRELKRTDDATREDKIATEMVPSK